MKLVALLAHDPGGYDVTYPVAIALKCAGAPVAYYCVGPAGTQNPNYQLKESFVESEIKRSIADRTLGALVTGRSWDSHFELDMIKLCKANNIKTFMILDYWSSYIESFLHPSGELILPHYYIVMDDLARQEAVAAGIPSDILYVLGQPGLDRYISERQAPLFKATKALVLSQPISINNAFSTDEALYDITEELVSHKIPFSIKFHPKESSDIKQKYGSLYDTVEGDLFSVANDFFLAVGMSTMALLYTVLKGIPSISYQPNAVGQDLCITNKLGLTKQLTTRPQLSKALENPMVPNVTSQYLWSDGESAQRVTNFILEVLHDL